MAGAAVLGLHELVAAHVAGLDEAERVEHAEGREDAKFALRERPSRTWRQVHGGRGLEGVDGLEERNDNDRN